MGDVSDPQQVMKYFIHGFHQFSSGTGSVYGGNFEDNQAIQQCESVHVVISCFYCHTPTD